MRHDPPFAVELTLRGPYAVLQAEGELDIAAVPRLQASIRRASQRSPRVVLDLRDVHFMDTFVLRALVRLSHEPTAAGRWSLHCVPGPAIQRLLDLAGARDRLHWISPEQLPG